MFPRHPYLKFALSMITPDDGGDGLGPVAESAVMNVEPAAPAAAVEAVKPLAPQGPQYVSAVNNYEPPDSNEDLIV
eukprot:NODE_2163_length_451_cov_194.639303_g2084_i0.p1 GENE.NODE_2163_length_451_cov_194.639303_g2084_i0~~NODE_2163_length_451_cov_194.639303_g2084_i0.p1  ORF type:complete len:76 (-),score=11.12 NODE_2163_length_451_cov_194.639303_g2084_i0:162-389(-)